jgi:hypothetical protein
MFSIIYSQPSSHLSHPSRIFVSKKANFATFLKSAGRANSAESIAYGPVMATIAGLGTYLKPNQA